MFQVTPIPAFNDNYIWTLADPAGPRVAVVDPGDAAPVRRYLEQRGLTLAAILVTHHHPDHTGGVTELAREFAAPVYGPAQSPFKGVDRPLNDGDSFELFGQTLAVREVPAHTLDHISYFNAGEPSQLFCGDTLFLAGCGRLFEGTAAQMQRAMDYFRTLPDDTEIYCTHEYSLSNLAFAAAVEPENDAIRDALERCRNLRDQHLPTLPSHIGSEKQINPFMRTHLDSVRESASRHASKALSGPVETLAAIREWKNQY
ncbi:hydroxyacylglutathione hydrolase [Marinobacterium nitratireducens]|uniref:Hydroxyacylglutathione hydrolase n=1 Tax=Marinobacterium nitratireducens TaxID=518897 RepID=A0A917ZEV1_9GAMM|nr:hydroxyacylglutathione hydrolase [Marinobacterium nitratireducens]GGO80589.1 hydroxyacylglutathione hydrolase [Marinobacterium nitratireducens]